MKKLLVLGAGRKTPPQLSGYQTVTVDIDPNVGADVVCDLDQTPWPFEDNEFDHVYMDNVLEHLTDVVKTMAEIHRITKQGADITIIVPYFRSKWACVDPTHRHFFTLDTMSYFVDGHPYNERYAFIPNKFSMLSKRFNENLDQTWFQRLLIPIAERYGQFYENKLSPIWPLEILTFHMQTLK
jgi:ubiquinone/menaquinone biosynthesis C-methylase UbiE